MKKIGGGLQYRVYKIDNSRVLKLPTSRIQKILKLLSWGCNPFLLKEKVISAEKITEHSLSGIKERIDSLDKTILGNPIFLKHSGYEQDFMTTVENYFKNHSLEENKVIVDKYVENIIETWRYGFSDTIFNFTINQGVQDGRVILIDLGELSFSKEEIQNLVKIKSWLNHRSYMSMADKELKSYVANTLNSRLTPQIFEENWLKNKQLNRPKIFNIKKDLPVSN